jgi:hypothetical protein
MKITNCEIFLILLALASIPLISAVSGWTITTDSISSTSVAWNVSQKPGTITALSYDGIQVSGFDPNAAVLVQSGLSGNETHNIAVTAGGILSNLSATTTESSNDVINDLFGRWSYVFVIIIFILAGAVIHWLFYWFGVGVSLYAEAEYIKNNPNIITDIWHVQFYLYLALFILCILLWFLRIRGRK